MKKFFAILSIAAIAFAVACTPENNTDEPQLPSAAGITPVVAVEGNVATFSLPEGTTGLIPVWFTNEGGDFAFAGNGNNFQKSFFKNGTFKVRMYVSNANGQSKDYSEADFTINAKIEWNGFDYTSEFNLWKKAEDEGLDMTETHTWYSPGWGGEQALPFTTNPYKITIPKGCSDKWQCQFHLVPAATAPVTLSAEKTYDFSCLIKLNKTAGVTVKLPMIGDDNTFLFDEVVDMVEGVNIFYMTDVKGFDGNVKVVFDFGYSQDGTEVEITRITLKDHANDDGTVAPAKEDKPEEADALDTSCTIKVGEATNLADLTSLAEEVGFYYAPNWAQIDNPAISEITKTGFTLVCPSATGARWQNQVSFKFNIDLSADKTYDFSCTVNSTTAFQYGVKLTSHADGEQDGLFFHDCKWHTALEAGKDCTFTIANVPGKTSPARLIFDFGGNPENTTIVVKDICLQEHIN